LGIGGRSGPDARIARPERMTAPILCAMAAVRQPRSHAPDFHGGRAQG
jgi:hypothetical protein